MHNLKKRKRVKKKLRTTQKDSSKHRENDLERLAEMRASEWNIKASQAIIVIRAAEEARQLHTKQRAFLKPERGGGIRKIIMLICPSIAHCTVYHQENLVTTLQLPHSGSI